MAEAKSTKSMQEESIRQKARDKEEAETLAKGIGKG